MWAVTNLNKLRNGSEKDCKFQWLTDWRTDELTNWRIDGRQVQYLREYVFNVDKCTLKNPGNIYKNPPSSSWKKCRRPMEKDRIGFSISFHQPGWNSIQTGNNQLFCYINSNCEFSKTFKKNVRSPIEKVRNELSIAFLETGGNSEQKDNVQVFYIQSYCIFSQTIPLWGHASK